jgi:hypothetical protein
MFDERSDLVDIANFDRSLSERNSRSDAIFDSLLTTLTNLDFGYEQELERIRVGSSSEEVKNRVVRRLQQEHRARREPYVQELARIHGRAAALRH